MNNNVITLSSINYSVLDDVELNKVDEKTFALQYSDRIFYIGEVLFDILTMLKLRKDIPEIKNNVIHKFQFDITEEKIEATVLDCITRLENKPRNKTTLYVYIYAKVKIIREKTLHKITQGFTFLINKWVLLAVFSISFLASFYFMGHIFTTGLITAKISLTQSVKYFLLHYLFIILAGLFHEIGHASAAARYKIAPKEIGFGFYLIFPVFYTDVSRIWLLNKYKRIVVNLGGIYFQFILNAVLVSIFFSFHFSHESQVLLKTLFIANSAMCLYSINPFMRNDGYWVYSDLFNIPNLTINARNYPKKFVAAYIKNKEGLVRSDKWSKFKKEVPLLIYSVLFHIVFGLLWVGLCLLTYKNYMSIKELLADPAYTSAPFVTSNILRDIGLLFTIGINVFFLYRTIGFYIRKVIKQTFKTTAA